MSGKNKLSNLEKFKLQQELIAKYNERRPNPSNPEESYFADVVFVRRGRVATKPDTFTKMNTLSFLQYLRPVMHWASRNSGLSKGQIELLLYLAPLGMFGQRDFNILARTIDVNSNSLFAFMRDEGWINQWRPAKPSQKQPALWQLSVKSAKLTNRIYKMLLGEDTIPDTKANVVKTSDKPMDEYWMHLARKMNRSIKERDDE